MCWRAIASACADRMVDVLNRRSYLRNLLRDIDGVLEASGASLTKQDCECRND